MSRTINEFISTLISWRGEIVLSLSTIDFETEVYSVVLYLQPMSDLGLKLGIVYIILGCIGYYTFEF